MSSQHLHDIRGWYCQPHFAHRDRSTEIELKASVLSVKHLEPIPFSPLEDLAFCTEYIQSTPG